MNTISTKTQATSPFLYLLIFIGLVITLSYFSVVVSIPISMNNTYDNWEKLDLAIEDFILRTETPPIDLTNEQVEEITSLYNDGMELNNNPNDPCQKLKLLGLKKLNKWVYQFKKRGFTLDKIKEIIEIGSRQIYNHPSGSKFTRIVHPDGTSIIIDFVNCAIWQIAPANF